MSKSSKKTYEPFTVTLPIPPNPKGRDCFAAKDFIQPLKDFMTQIDAMILKLEKKKKDDQFKLVFEFDFEDNGVVNLSDNGEDVRKLALGCYCNGGG